MAVIGLVIGLAGSGMVGAADQDPLAGLPALVESIRVEWGVPGVALAVVQGDRTVYSGGFGVLGVRDKSPVTPQTIFGIGSATKAFTATAAAMLVDEGILAWDDRVRTALPNFHLRDGQTTLNCTLKDLLAHRTGLPRHDALWYRSDLGRDEMIHRLRYLESSAPFRDRFQYSNLMYMVAGRMIGQASGATWEAFIHGRILQPLMMSRTFFEEAPKTESDIALPHRLGPSDVALSVPAYTGWAIGPALSMCSSADDMSLWIKAQLAAGHDDRQTILPDEVIKELQQPVVTVPAPPTPETPLSAYALGWFAQTYRGRLMVHHVGSIDGYYSLVAFLPFEDIGIVVLTNRSRNRVPEVLSRWVFDRLLGLAEVDWNRRFREQHLTLLELEKAEWTRINALKDLDAPPILPLDAYVGSYDHPAYGRLMVEFREDGDLTGEFRDLAGWLEHLTGETFIFHFDAEALGDRFIMTFASSDGDQINAVAARLQSGVAPVVFERVIGGPRATTVQNPAIEDGV
ncbi:MAG: serine hydrolase [Acidobacteriota bacterium]